MALPLFIWEPHGTEDSAELPVPAARFCQSDRARNLRTKVRGVLIPQWVDKDEDFTSDYVMSGMEAGESCLLVVQAPEVRSRGSMDQCAPVWLRKVDFRSWI